MLLAFNVLFVELLFNLVNIILDLLDKEHNYLCSDITLLY